MVLIDRIYNFLYNKDKKRRDNYTVKKRNEINSLIEKYLGEDNYFLGFGCALKWYRDQNFFDEDLDYAVICSSLNRLLEIPKKDKRFKLIMESWNGDLPTLIKMSYKNKAQIDFFFINEIGGKKYICAMRESIKKIKSDRKEYKYASLSIDEYFLYEDYGTQLVEFNGSKYRFPKNIENYLENFYGNWKIKLNKEESNNECRKNCKVFNEFGKTYWSKRFA